MNKKRLFESQKHVFWTALILSIFVFAGGIFLGFLLENYRTGKLDVVLAQSELDLLDVKIQNDLYSFSDINCSNVIQENINFADRIYEEAKMLDKYEQASRLSGTIILQHKKYDLLRTLFWINAIKLKQRCNASYHNVVYIYDYNNPRLDIKAKQIVFSRILSEIKQEKGKSVMLIPIAGDNNIYSVNILMNSFNISEQELPVILIDEKIKIKEVENKEEIKKFLD
ncbi:hypothetical protein FJZ19_01300 [Candidatus Pacearchaeota archaeon]|nr:hypothetical protein [Candidatus Pacearchaeota archaeon]